ncbi:MAG: type II toxin-antitoxin system RelB/DinJ family antitoxin [Bacilli bacterium]|nr:type II toxin-antitoxin system RelB/DinJ family antitoxin [Bacilli bacterium]
MANISNAINMSFRVDKDLKKQADELFRNLGMNTSVALNMFLTQSVREQSIPFIPSIEIPNARLMSAIEEVEAIESGKIKAKKYKSFEEAIEDID